MTNAWIGDWYQRIKDRVHERGFANATAFADTSPSLSMVDLADTLGREDVAANQLRRVLLDEAIEAGAMARCARGLLTRELRDRLPGGWQLAWDDMECGPATQRAGAWASWATSLGERYESATDRVWENLISLPIPAGWLPEDADDPWLIQVFGDWQDPDDPT